MRGVVTVRVGRYRVSESASIAVTASDAGTVIVFEDRQLHRRHTAVVDEDGRLVWPPSHQATCPLAGTAREDVAVLEPPESAPAPPPATPTPRKARRARKTEKRVQFKIKFNNKSPLTDAYVVGGYANQKALHVLCVIEAPFNWHNSIMLLEGKRVCVGHAVPPADVLHENKWARFLALPDYRSFQLSRWWKKMPLDELRKSIEGRTFRCDPPQTPK